MKIKQLLYYVVIAVLLIIFLISAFYVGRYVMDSRQQKENYNNLASIVEQARVNAEQATADPDATVDPDAPAEETEPPILPEYQELYEMNNDLVGWLKIEDTQINYPVMQTPDSVDYYLSHNFDKEYNVHGCLYAREQCDVSEPSDNITIYGHHMRDGSMFGSLKNYTKKSYWKEHDMITFDTLTEHHTYQIFAVFKTTAGIETGFAYHKFVDAEDEADFDEFIATCKDLALYDTGIAPEYGDKIICLSTCEYSHENGRLVVAAVRVS